MVNRVFKNLFIFIFCAALVVFGGVSKAHAQASALQNLEAPGFICPGESVTITFQAEVAAGSQVPYIGGVLSPVSATSFNSATDYLFMYTGGSGTTASSPGAWPFDLDNAFTVTPPGNLSFVTYSWVTKIPAGLTTNEVIYINIAGSASSDWVTDLNMTSDIHLSLAVTVNCNDAALQNIGIFGGSSSMAPLVILGGSTNTATNTSTTTPTHTPTMTATVTSTNTVTNTATMQNTATVTNTDTTTPTNTVTNTVTDTDTSTVTDTPAVTFTFTNTPTVTDTNTVTNTVTVTLTNTVTNTDTVTSTNTVTATVTNTDTVTLTNTATNTATVTNTMQFTSTFTNTTTPTPTYTFTQTPTPTSFVAIGKTVSETQANSGDILTYNIAVTVTGPTLTNPVITDTLPADMTFQDFGNSPSGTATSFNQNTDQLQWTLPSPLAAGVYTLTYQTKVNTFAPANVPLTNYAQLTYAGLLNPKTASVPVTVIGNFTVSVDIYNSSGEVVKTIPIQSFSTAINNITLSTSNTITTLSGPGSTIYILFNGFVIGTWDGTNNSGQPVENGTYQIQITNVSNTGIATSVSQNAVVNRALSSVTVDIFNSAGEAVRKLYNVVDNPTTSNMTNVTLSVDVLRLNASSIPSNAASSQLKIYVEDTNNPVTLVWDGTSDGGNFVTPGEYQIEVHWTNGSGSTTDITRSVLVMPGTGISGFAVAEPNVLTTATGMNTTFNAMGVMNAAGLKVKIYTISGELVQTLTSGTPTVGWNASGLASGIYIANLEIDNASGGALNNQRLKILVLH